MTKVEQLEAATNKALEKVFDKWKYSFTAFY